MRWIRILHRVAGSWLARKEQQSWSSSWAMPGQASSTWRRRTPGRCLISCSWWNLILESTVTCCSQRRSSSKRRWPLSKIRSNEIPDWLLCPQVGLWSNKRQATLRIWPNTAADWSPSNVRRFWILQHNYRWPRRGHLSSLWQWGGV